MSSLSRASHPRERALSLRSSYRSLKRLLWVRPVPSAARYSSRAFLASLRAAFFSSFSFLPSSVTKSLNRSSRSAVSSTAPNRASLPRMSSASRHRVVESMRVFSASIFRKPSRARRARSRFSSFSSRSRLVWYSASACRRSPSVPSARQRLSPSQAFTASDHLVVEATPRSSSISLKAAAAASLLTYASSSSSSSSSPRTPGASFSPAAAAALTSPGGTRSRMSPSSKTTW
mmetsp:Transcript_39172/g.67750  ORF Transcript_39172/g.67750 Transcript_39172/m.67750 type:complete len:232 (+) Transcript_39172:1543-2238(+)